MIEEDSKSEPFVIPEVFALIQGGSKYEALAKRAIEEHKLIDLLPVPYDWETEPDFFCGRYIAANEAEIDGKKFFLYIFETDKGLRSVYLGSVIDSQQGIFQVDGVYLVNRLEDKTSNAKRAYHQYRVLRIQE